LQIFDTVTDADRTAGVSALVSAVSNEHLVIIPTDTGYAVCGDAFSTAATRRIRTVKGMPANAPLQVLIGTVRALEGVAENATAQVRSLAEAFWPGPLTMIVPTSRSLTWDIGGDPRFVQLRVPNHPVAVELLSRTGPLAASSARSGSSAVESAEDVGDLEHHVAAFLSAGAIKQEGLSTIVDCTSDEVAILRKGPITVGQLVDVLGYMPKV
jgi:tRNA threonylcarbamoyl adenosine modification protein (Sua5/YciO/YrdC/YwlC family)